MKYIVIFLIEIYQKYISPYKGFRCAHAALYGGASCSEAVKNIIYQQGVFNGYQDSKKRFQACSQAHENLKQRRKQNRCIDSFDCSIAEICLPEEMPELNCMDSCSFDVPCDCSF